MTSPNRQPARGAALDMALEERLGKTAPPDLWPALSARLGPTPPKAKGNGSGWLPRAAAVLLGLGVVFAVYTLREQPSNDIDPNSQQPTPQRFASYRDAPESIEELRRWLRLAPLRNAGALTHSIHHAASGRDLRLRPLLFEGFSTPYRVDIEFSKELEDQLTAELLTAPLIVRSIPDLFGQAQHLIRGVSGDHRIEIQVTGCCRIPTPSAADAQTSTRFAVTLQDGRTGIVLSRDLSDQLVPKLIEVTENMIRLRGLATDAAGLSSLVPKHTRRLTPIALGPASIDDILSFHQLRHLDLRESPALHDSSLLRGLADLPGLRTLQVDGRHLDGDALTALGYATQLREIFFRPPGDDAIDVQVQPSRHRSAACITDANVSFLAGMNNLDELEIGGANISDAGLAQIVKLSKLRKLYLLDARNLSAAGIQHLRSASLEILDLRRTGLPFVGIPRSVESVGIDAATFWDQGKLPPNAARDAQERDGTLWLDGTNAGLTATAWAELLNAVASRSRFDNIHIHNASIDDSALRGIKADPDTGKNAVDIGFANCPGVSNSAIEVLDNLAGYDCYRLSRSMW